MIYIPPLLHLLRSPSTSESDAYCLLRKLTARPGAELHVTMLQHPYIGSAADVCAEFINKNDTYPLLILDYLSRNFLSSGFGDPSEVRPILESMESVNFKAFFKHLEEVEKQKLTHLWVGHYLDDGCHPYHRDKRFTGTHRWIISLGCLEKEFWLKSGDAEVGIMLRHGTVVCMSAKASGNASVIKHAAKGKAKGSWVVIIETKYVG